MAVAQSQPCPFVLGKLGVGAGKSERAWDDGKKGEQEQRTQKTSLFLPISFSS